MTTNDITRFLHQPQKHYSAARMQQGRVLLDSDFNEGESLAADDFRRALITVTGGMGSPDSGFALGIPSEEEEGAFVPASSPLTLQLAELFAFGANAADVLPFYVLPGTLYVGGMRFVLEQAEHIVFQRDFLQARAEDVLIASPRVLYYLNAWEQQVTAAEDHQLKEPALGGPDTGTRTRRMRRVERLSLSSAVDDCAGAKAALAAELDSRGAEWDPLTGEARSKGRLQLVFQDAPDDDACTPDPPSEYVGTEHQTLRVMLTRPDAFVWALGNAAPLYRAKLTGLFGDPLVELLTSPPDELHRPRVNQVVEILPLGALLDDSNTPVSEPHDGKMATEIGDFFRITELRGEREFVVDAATGTRSLTSRVGVWSEDHPGRDRLNLEANPHETRTVFVRFWHIAEPPDDLEVPASADPGQPSLGRTGIVPIFHQQGQRGDFWVASLRTNDRRRLVPRDLNTNDDGVRPHGPRHFYAPLAFVNTDDDHFEDCRIPLRKPNTTSCQTYTVGDGINSFGDYTSIQEAIDAIASTGDFAGGIIAVRAGVFREEIRIDRDNVTIEGCGPETILRTPDDATATELIFTSGHGTTIAKLTIEADDQAALHADGSDRLRLEEVAVVETTEDSGPSSAPIAPPPLITLAQTNDAEFREVRFATRERGAVSAEGGLGLRMANCSFTNDATWSSAVVTPALTLAGVDGAIVRDSKFTCFGRVGIVVTGNATDVRLLHLVLDTRAQGTTARTATAIELDEAARATVDECEILQEGTPSEHAAIVAFASETVVSRNRIRSLPDQTTGWAVAWGGIQVRGNSRNVEVRDNHISGGLGYGITLGSVRFGQAGTRAGAGAVLANFDLSGSVAPHVTGELVGGLDGQLAGDEGPIINVRIIQNRIEGMGSNGISVLTLLGQADTDPELLEATHLRIERNVIHGNLTQVPDQELVRTSFLPLSSSESELNLPIQVLPQAGICLGVLTGGATIRDNHITGNGDTSYSPTSGIFVLLADALVISGNRIQNNGGFASAAVTPFPGVRAGIAVMLAGAEEAAQNDDFTDLLSVSADPLVEAASLDHSEFAARISGNSVQHPEGRALHLTATGMVSVEGNFLSSQGHHGSDTSPDLFLIGDVVFVQNFGGPWETVNADSLAPGEGTDFAGYDTPGATRDILTNSNALSPQLYMGSGGGILFNNNQVTYDWEVKRLPDSGSGAPLSFFPVAVMGQDHVAVIGNQFALRLSGVQPGDTPSPSPGGTPANEPLLAHALIGGVTTQVARNRIAEPVLACTLSLITSSQLLGITAFNQSTHPTFGFRWAGTVDDDPAAEDLGVYIERNNLALFTHNSADFVQLRNALKGPIRDFFNILHQRA